MVHFCCDTNSTLFTDCCGTAICDDESKCPKCGKEITLSSRARWKTAMLKLYGPKRLKEIRGNKK